MLHLQYLSTPFRGFPGLRLLEEYYREVSRGRGAVGYVAQDGSAVLGYVCGVWAPKEVRRALLRTHWSTLALWGAVGTLMHPGLFAAAVRRLSRPAAQDAVNPARSYELRPIVVTESARGTGAAIQLVRRLMLDAHERGYDRIHLFVGDDNVAASAFYLKMGFAPIVRTNHDGSPMTRFERAVSEAA